jgi:starch synthase
VNLRILFASAELSPLAQTGGLGEVVRSLAGALVARGHAVTCAVPAYPSLLDHPEAAALAPDPRHTGVTLPTPGGPVRARWLRMRLPDGVELRALDAPRLFAPGDLYGSPGAGPSEAALPFIALARAVADDARGSRPQVLVAHDWHAALAVGLLRALPGGEAPDVATVQVVHNGAYLGRAPASTIAWTGLPAELFRPDGVEFYGDLALLKAGLAFADRIVAVSPGYARELETPDFGSGLDGLYRARHDRLVGIVNGIDTERYDPARDDALAMRFDAGSPEARVACREALVRELGLEAPEPGRLLGAIGRLTTQKGWDVLAEALPRLVSGGASLALLGDGEPALAERLLAEARRSPRRVAVRIGWDDALARRLYAGSDCVLVPSRFEPCGLVQLLAQRYGALPIAHAVGGLVDTIQDGDTGILFSPLTAPGLVAACERAAALVRARGSQALARRLLSLDVSWALPAARWEALLAEVVRERSSSSEVGRGLPVSRRG